MLDLSHTWTGTDSWTQLLILAGLKGTLLLALGFAAAFLLRRNSASLRHLTWSLLLAALLLLPVLSLAAPSLPLQVLPWTAAVEDPAKNAALPRQDAMASDSAADAPSRMGSSPSSLLSASPGRVEPLMPLVPGPVPWPVTFSTSQVLMGLWLAGFLLAVGRLVLATALLRQELARAKQSEDPAWNDLLNQVGQRLGLQRPVRLRLGRAQQMPLVWGLVRPTILLPGQAENWTRQERWAVLLHEAAHIKRHDLLVQFVASLACAVYWFNPLVWTAAKAIRREREQACDDLVLCCGTPPSTYARQLLTLAQRMKGARLVSAASLAMSRPSELEGRLLSILNGRQNRGTASPRVMLALAVLILLAAGPLAALTPVPQEEAPQTTQEEAGATESGVSASGVSASGSSAAVAQGQSGGGTSVAAAGSGIGVRSASSGRSRRGIGLGGTGVGSGASQSSGGVWVASGNGSGSSAGGGSAAALTQSSQTHEQSDPGERSGQISLSERDGTRWRIQMEGLQVDRDYALKGIAEGGYLRIEVRRQGRTEVLTVEPREAGGLQRSYKVEDVLVNNPEAAEALLQEGLARLRKTDVRQAETRLWVEEARLHAQELRQDHQRQVRDAHEALAASRQVRDHELDQVLQQTKARLGALEQLRALRESDFRHVLRALEEQLRTLRDSEPRLDEERLEATQKTLRAALSASRQALDADQTRLASEMAELAEGLQHQLSEVRDQHAVAMDRIAQVQRQLHEELESGLGESMQVLRDSMDRVSQEMDHLRSNLQAARDRIGATLWEGLEGHNLGWERPRLGERIDSLVNDLLSLGELSEEDGRFHFSASRQEVLSLLHEALADPLDHLQGSDRNSLRDSLNRVADQLSNLRW